MDHLDRDELILLHYGEAVRPGAREHLLGCEACRSESELLRRVLQAVDENSETEEPAPQWEEQLWNRLRWKLERPRRRPLAWMAVAAAAMIAVVAAALFLRRPAPAPAPQQVHNAPAPAAPVTTPAQARERVLLVVLGDHLSRSERVLTEVKNSSADAPALVIADRETLEDLVRKNRLYIDAAYSSNQTSLANVLEQMQPLLLELARAPEKPTARDIETLQKRIEKRGAVVKLRLAEEQIRQRQSL